MNGGSGPSHCLPEFSVRGVKGGLSPEEGSLEWPPAYLQEPPHVPLSPQEQDTGALAAGPGDGLQQVLPESSLRTFASNWLPSLHIAISSACGRAHKKPGFLPYL